MRKDDHMMTVLTGLVVAVGVGTLVQSTDSIKSLFQSEVELQVDDDVFFVRSGTTSSLDVLANDYAGIELAGKNIEILSTPACGTVSQGENGVVYANDGMCAGKVSFSYCVDAGEECKSARVVLNVREAPSAVADAYLPKKGGLVPLPNPANAQQNISSDATPIKAFVVSFGAAALASKAGIKADLDRFMMDTSGLDLGGATADLGRAMKDLHSVDVPLSATRTARFLSDYSTFELAALEIANVSLGEAPKLSAPQVDMDLSNLRPDLNVDASETGLQLPNAANSISQNNIQTVRSDAGTR